MKIKLYTFITSLAVIFLIVVSNTLATSRNGTMPVPEEVYEPSYISGKSDNSVGMELNDRPEFNKNNYIKPFFPSVNEDELPPDAEILPEIMPFDQSDEGGATLWGMVPFPSLPAEDPSLTKSEDGSIIYWVATVDDGDHPHPFFRVYKSNSLGLPGTWEYVCGVFNSSYGYWHPDIVVTETRIILVGSSEYSGYSIISASWDLNGNDFNSAYVAVGDYIGASICTDGIDYSEGATWIYCSYVDNSSLESCISYSTDLVEPSWSQPCVISEGETVSWVTPGQAMAYANDRLFNIFEDDEADILVSRLSIFDLCNPIIENVHSTDYSLTVPCIAAFSDQVLAVFCTYYRGEWDIGFDYSMDRGDTWGDTYWYFPQVGYEYFPGIDVSLDGIFGFSCTHEYDGNYRIQFDTMILPEMEGGGGVVENGYNATRTVALMPSGVDLQDNCAVSWTVGDNTYFAWGSEPQTGIESDPSSGLPSGISLTGNHPNPFNAQTIISYALAEATDVKITICNLLGQGVITLYQGFQQAGEHSITWDATDFPSGVYFYRIEAGEFAETRKMLLLK